MTHAAPQIVTSLADDGYAFHCRRWDASDPIADVIVLHGIISHSGWYFKTGSHLAASGFNVHSLDRRGSGLNIQDRGDVSSVDRWILDVKGYIQSIQTPQLSATQSARPVILVGISWGGLLATAVARRCADQVSAIALLCPGFFSRKGTSQLQHRVVSLANSVGLGGLRFPVPLRDPKLFTRSPHWQAYIRDDPFTLRRVTLRLATASARLYHDTIHAPQKVASPTLLMLGEQDLIIHNDQVREFVSRYFGESQSTIAYPNSAHTLEFEDEPREYLDDLARWCREVAQLAP